MKRHLTAGFLAVAVCGAWAQAAPPAPPSNLHAMDHPLDGGTNIDVIWNLSPDDRLLTEEEVEAGVPRPVAYYKVLRSMEVNGKYDVVGQAVPEKWDYPGGVLIFRVEECEREEEYYFRVAAVGPDGTESQKTLPVKSVATRAWFDGHPSLAKPSGEPRRVGRFWVMVITVILCSAVIFWINYARKGKPIKLRKIAGLEAVDEAVGRATEMGRPILFVPGILDMNDIQTIAGITILARVSKTAARYDARVEVPTAWALVMATARETVHAAYLEAGRPDAYSDDLIYYVTNEQFGYVAYLQGMMVRQKPAACFYMGSFFAESLILAETGNSIGAIQVAGTAQPAQLPFFVAACDYTLIGEEFFAASAYLSGTPEELGSLKGQDLGKIIVAFGLLVGVGVATLGVLLPGSARLELITNFIKEYVMQ